MTGATRGVSHGEGREALLRATVRVVAERGLRGMTFRAVAEEAGVNNTLIAHHFGSRDNLISAALTWSADRSLGAADLAEYAVGTTSFRDALVRNVLSDPDVELFQFEMTLEASRRPELRPAIRELYRRYITEFTSEHAKITSTRSDGLNLALFAALDGLMLQYLSHAITVEELTGALDALVAAVTPGVAPARGN